MLWATVAHCIQSDRGLFLCTLPHKSLCRVFAVAWSSCEMERPACNRPVKSHVWWKILTIPLSRPHIIVLLTVKSECSPVTITYRYRWLLIVLALSHTVQKRSVCHISPSAFLQTGSQGHNRKWRMLLDSGTCLYIIIWLLELWLVFYFLSACNCRRQNTFQLKKKLTLY